MKFKIAFIVLAAFMISSSCQQPQASNISNQIGKVKVTILYPNSEGKTFDMDYYSEKHMPMVASLLGSSLKNLSIDKGVASGTPDETIPYLAIGYLYFDKLSDYQNSFGPNAEKIIGDIPNYTNIQPIVQISEVLQ